MIPGFHQATVVFVSCILLKLGMVTRSMNSTAIFEELMIAHVDMIEAMIQCNIGRLGEIM